MKKQSMKHILYQSLNTLTLPNVLLIAAAMICYRYETAWNFNKLVDKKLK